MKRIALLVGGVLAAACAPAFDDQKPRITEGPTVSVVRDTTATVLWITNERANSLVEYGETDDYGTVEIDNLYLETHVVTIKNLLPETTYHLRAASYDLFGNGPARSDDVEIVTLAPQPPPDIVITEVLANAVNESTGEFIELFNNGSDAVDLTGFTISDGTGSDTLQAYQDSSTLLEPGDYALILDSQFAGDFDLPAGVVLMTTADTTLTGGTGISNTTDTVSLFAPGQSVVASSYGSPDVAFDAIPFDPGDGFSVERIDAGSPDEVSNWCKSATAGGTPGAAPSCS